MDNATRIRLLEEIGFTNFEAEVYVALLGNSPQTGYSLAKKINKTRSSTYLVLSTLQKKGALRVSEDSDRLLYIPVPIEEYLEIREKQFLRQKNDLIDAFDEFQVETENDMIFRLKNSLEFYHRAEKLIAEAEGFLLVDSSHKQLQRIKPSLVNAAENGKQIFIEYYQDIEIHNCTLIKGFDNNYDSANLPFKWCGISADSDKFLIGYFTNNDSLISGIYVSNFYLATGHSHGMFHEILYRYILDLFGSEDDKKTIFSKIVEFQNKFSFDTLGYRKFKERISQF